MNQITSMTALSLGECIKNKEISVAEAVKAQIKIIKEREPIYNSYITVLEEEAYIQAEQVQKQIDDGKLSWSPLAGVSMAVKDNICTKNIKTTSASKMLSNYIPSYDATVVSKLKQAGAIIIGKTNMDEFAMGSTSETSYYGPSKNPWNQNHVPGGSSGGSSAAVAGEEAFYSLGTDTGGSIRQPAAYCGITGIKPTYGTVSRYGLIAYASSLDGIGTFGRDVSDCIASLDIISGHDPLDGSSVEKSSYSYTKALIDDVKGMRIGVPKDFLGEGLDDDIRKSTLDAIEIFRSRGALVEECDLSYLEYAIPAYYAISCSEASSNLSRYDGVRYGYRTGEYDDIQELYMNSRSEGFGMEVKQRLMIGGLVLSSEYYEAYYHKAIKIRRLIQESYMKAFESYDVLLGPATPETAPALNDTTSDPQKRKLSGMYSSSVNLAGLPAISVPSGIDKSGLPIGLQLIGGHFKENNIIRAAYTFECEMGGAIRNERL